MSLRPRYIRRGDGFTFSGSGKENASYSVVGCPMNRNKALFFVFELAAVSFSSCSGLPNKCTTNCNNGGTATVSATLAAVPLIPPPGTNILSFVVTITGISLTPTSGSAVSLTLPVTSVTVDLMRLQSDSILLGQALASVPAATYNKITVSVSSVVVTYCTQTSPGTSGCTTGTVAQITQAATVPATSSFSITLSNNEQAGVQVQFNLANALTLSATQPQVVSKVDLTATNVLTASVLPPTASSLATGELDFVEDVTGSVTASSSSSVTVKTATRGSITAAINPSSFFGVSCVTTSASCPPAVGQFASIDTALNSDGTFTLLAYDALASSTSDWIEGIVSLTPSSTSQFQIVANDVTLASSGSVIGTKLVLGDPVQVTLSGSVNPFVVDSHGYPVVTTPFTGSNSASNILPGQTVAVHVTAFTAKNGTTLAAATVDTVILRFTRVSGNVSTVASPFISLQSLPPFFGATLSLEVQISTGSPSTNFVGSADASSLSGANVSVRALYFGSTFNPSFSAAKVRKH